VTDPENDQASDEVSICINTTNMSPEAILANEYLSVAGGEQVTIDGSASRDQDGNIASYSWEPVGGSSAITDSIRSYLSAGDETLSFTAPNIEGHVEIQLTVTDNEGATDSQKMTLSISASDEPLENQEPTADAGDNISAEEGETVTLDGSQSFDPDGEISYSWELSSSGIDVSIANADKAQASFVAPMVDGTTELTFKLTVTDDSGASNFDTVKVSVSESQDENDANGNGMMDAREIKDTTRDMNQDGTPDFEDPSSVSFHHVNNSEEAIGFFSCCGSTLREVKNLKADDADVPQQGKPEAEFPYGVFSY